MKSKIGGIFGTMVLVVATVFGIATPAQAVAHCALNLSGWWCLYTTWGAAESDAWPGTFQRNICVGNPGALMAVWNQTNSVWQVYRGSDHGCSGATVGIPPGFSGNVSNLSPGWTGIGSWYRKAAN